MLNIIMNKVEYFNKAGFNKLRKKTLTGKYSYDMNIDESEDEQLFFLNLL